MPSVFERVIKRVMSGLTYMTLLINLDGIIVYSKTFETHLEILKGILERLKEA